MATTFDQQVQKHTEKLAAAIKRQIEKDNNDAWRAAEKKRTNDKNAKAEAKALFSKRAHIFFRLISENPKFGDGWVLKVLSGCEASDEIKKVFAIGKNETTEISKTDEKSGADAVVKITETTD